MKQWTRLIAMLLAVMTVVQMLPLNVLAAQEKPDEATQTRISQVVQAEPSAQAVQPAAEPEPEIPETESAAAMTEPDYGVAAVSDDTGFSWTLEEGVLTISGAGEMPWSDTSVPWYDQKDTVTSVVIGDGITRISSAFGTHSALTEVTIADSVTGIQGGAFQECTALRAIDLPAGITHLESDMFWGCTALERVGLPAGLTTIDNNVFLDCASLGSAAVPAILAWIGITVATIAASAAISYFLEKGYNAVLEKAKALGCSSDPDAGPLMRYMTPMVDPSGYVYEAVPSNRLEGVKAEIYYADNGQQILWNAADYEQINPLYTDSDGKYQWDVPFGLWLVKYSKDGYLDTDSRNDPAANDDGYLPVPPPQVDVNVGMVSTAAPQVESVNVYQDQVQVIFSQYMKPESVELVVSAGSEQISGTFEAANAEYNYEGTAQYATVFNFTPDAALSGNVTVSVSGAVNYAGTAMESAYSRTKTVVYRPEHITVTQTAPLVYGGTSQLEIQILPAKAGANQTLTVGAPAQGIVDADQQTIATDAQGKASITLRGTLPGEGPVIVSLDGPFRRSDRQRYHGAASSL